jgi:hypothetical protein
MLLQACSTIFVNAHKSHVKPLVHGASDRKLLDVGATLTPKEVTHTYRMMHDARSDSPATTRYMFVCKCGRHVCVRVCVAAPQHV